jgi:hypothetical protein
MVGIDEDDQNLFRPETALPYVLKWNWFIEGSICFRKKAYFSPVRPVADSSIDREVVAKTFQSYVHSATSFPLSEWSNTEEMESMIDRPASDMSFSKWLPIWGSWPFSSHNRMTRYDDGNKWCKIIVCLYAAVLLTSPNQKLTSPTTRILR